MLLNEKFYLPALKNSILAPLVYRPGKHVGQLLNDFIQSNVFVPEEDPEDENEQDDHTKIETLHKMTRSVFPSLF